MRILTNKIDSIKSKDVFLEEGVEASKVINDTKKELNRYNDNYIFPNMYLGETVLAVANDNELVLYINDDGSKNEPKTIKVYEDGKLVKRIDSRNREIVKIKLNSIVNSINTAAIDIDVISRSSKQQYNYPSGALLYPTFLADTINTDELQVIDLSESTVQFEFNSDSQNITEIQIFLNNTKVQTLRVGVDFEIINGANADGVSKIRTKTFSTFGGTNRAYAKVVTTSTTSTKELLFESVGKITVDLLEASDCAKRDYTTNYDESIAGAPIFTVDLTAARIDNFLTAGGNPGHIMSMRVRGTGIQQYGSDASVPTGWKSRFFAHAGAPTLLNYYFLFANAYAQLGNIEVQIEVHESFVPYKLVALSNIIKVKHIRSCTCNDEYKWYFDEYLDVASNAKVDVQQLDPMRDAKSIVISEPKSSNKCALEITNVDDPANFKFKFFEDYDNAYQRSYDVYVDNKLVQTPAYLIDEIGPNRFFDYFKVDACSRKINLISQDISAEYTYFSDSMIRNNTYIEGEIPVGIKPVPTYADFYIPITGCDINLHLKINDGSGMSDIEILGSSFTDRSGTLYYGNEVVLGSGPSAYDSVKIGELVQKNLRVDILIDGVEKWFILDYTNMLSQQVTSVFGQEVRDQENTCLALKIKKLVQLSMGTVGHGASEPIEYAYMNGEQYDERVYMDGINNQPIIDVCDPAGLLEVETFYDDIPTLDFNRVEIDLTKPLDYENLADYSIYDCYTQGLPDQGTPEPVFREFIVPTFQGGVAKDVKVKLKLADDARVEKVLDLKVASVNFSGDYHYGGAFSGIVNGVSEGKTVVLSQDNQYGDEIFEQFVTNTLTLQYTIDGGDYILFVMYLSSMSESIRHSGASHPYTATNTCLNSKVKDLLFVGIVLDGADDGPIDVNEAVMVTDGVTTHRRACPEDITDGTASSLHANDAIVDGAPTLNISEIYFDFTGGAKSPSPTYI